MAAREKTVIKFPSVTDQAYKESRRHLKVGDIMSRKVIMTSPETTMMQAAMIMGEKHIGSLIVTKYKNTRRYCNGEGSALPGPCNRHGHEKDPGRGCHVVPARQDMPDIRDTGSGTDHDQQEREAGCL